MVTSMIWTLAFGIPVILWFREKPNKPPSYVSVSERVDFVETLK